MSDLHLTNTLESPDFEQLYRALVHNLPTFAIFALDGSGRISSWNKGVETNLGYSEREFVGQRFELIFTEEDRRNHIPALEMARAKREGHAPDRRWHVRKDGTRLFVDGTLTALTDDTGQVIGFCKIMRDATQEHLAEQRLASALDYSESIVDTVRQPLLVLDTDLRVVSANRSFYRDFTAVPEATEGCLLHELGGGEWNTPRLRELLEEVLPRQSTIDDFEVQHEFPGIGRRIMLLNARKLCREIHSRQLVLLAIEDVTARKQAEASLRESEEFARSILASSPDCVKVLDLEGRLLSLNESGCQQMEIADLSACLNLPWPDMWGPEREAARNAVAEAASGNTVRFESYCPTLKGTPKWWEVIVTPIRDTSGQPVRLLSLSRDITDRRGAEQERERLLRELKRSNSELSDFAHVAAHDLQTPLRTILSYAQLLDRRIRGQLDETSREFLQMVLEGGARMDQLVRALLNYAQVGQGTPALRELSMQLVVDGALDNLQALISESEAKIICGELPIVLGEGVQLLQLVQNLVSNGVKYARPGVAPRIQIAADRADHFWRFSFQDNGQGIAPEHCQQIFQPFRRLHGYEIAGTGMGLAVARKIVERHGGQLWVESDPGEGSTFFFTLPSGRI